MEEAAGLVASAMEMTMEDVVAEDVANRNLTYI